MNNTLFERLSHALQLYMKGLVCIFSHYDVTKQAERILFYRIQWILSNQRHLTQTKKKFGKWRHYCQANYKSKSCKV